MCKSRSKLIESGKQISPEPLKGWIDWASESSFGKTSSWVCDVASEYIIPKKFCEGIQYVDAAGANVVEVSAAKVAETKSEIEERVKSVTETTQAKISEAKMRSYQSVVDSSNSLLNSTHEMVSKIDTEDKREKSPKPESLQDVYDQVGNLAAYTRSAVSRRSHATYSPVSERISQGYSYARDTVTDITATGQQVVNIATAPRQSLREAWDSLHPDEPRPASDLHVASGVVIKKIAMVATPPTKSAVRCAFVCSQKALASEPAVMVCDSMTSAQSSANDIQKRISSLVSSTTTAALNSTPASIIKAFWLRVALQSCNHKDVVSGDNELEQNAFLDHDMTSPLIKACAAVVDASDLFGVTSSLQSCQTYSMSLVDRSAQTAAEARNFISASVGKVHAVQAWAEEA